MSVETYYKRNLAAMDENLKRDLDDNETLHANKAKVIKENYGLEIDTKNQAYDDDLRANEVQKYINMREVAENNANLGLTDSGLNRTQSTAVQLSASNNAAKIERDRNNMVRALEVETNRYLTENENSRISSAASIKKGYEDSAMSSAVDMYKADVDAAAKYNDSIIAAQEKYNTQKKTDYSNLYKHLSENSEDLDYCAKLIDEYIKLYGVDDESSEVSALLKVAELTLADLNQYKLTGNTIYYTQDDYDSETDENKKEYMLTRGANDYKTGSQQYKIVLQKSTGNFLWAGVDNNDVVDIYYSDGTLLKKDVKLGDLKDGKGNKAALAITNWTSGKKKGAETTLELDLSNISL